MAKQESRTHISLENVKCARRNGMCQEEEVRALDECGMEEFGTLDSSEETFAILEDRWWPHAAK